MEENKNYEIILRQYVERYKKEGENCDIFLVKDQDDGTFTIKNFIKDGNFHFELYDQNNNKIIEYENKEFKITGEATKKEDFDNWIKILEDFKKIVKDDNIDVVTDLPLQTTIFYSVLARYSVQLKDSKDCEEFSSKIDKQIALLKIKSKTFVTQKNENSVEQKIPNTGNILEEEEEENGKELEQESMSIFQCILKRFFPVCIYNLFYPKEKNNDSSINSLEGIQSKNATRSILN